MRSFWLLRRVLHPWREGRSSTELRLVHQSTVYSNDRESLRGKLNVSISKVSFPFFETFLPCKITKKEIPATIEVGKQITHPFFRIFCFNKIQTNFRTEEKRDKKLDICGPPRGFPAYFCSSSFFKIVSIFSKLIRIKYSNFQKAFNISKIASAPCSPWQSLIVQI